MLPGFAGRRGRTNVYCFLWSVSYKIRSEVRNPAAGNSLSNSPVHNAHVRNLMEEFPLVDECSFNNSQEAQCHIGHRSTVDIHSHSLTSPQTQVLPSTRD